MYTNLCVIHTLFLSARTARAVISLLQSPNNSRMRKKKRHCCRPVSSAALFSPIAPTRMDYTPHTVCLFVCCSFFPLARLFFNSYFLFSYNSQSTLFITHILYVCIFIPCFRCCRCCSCSCSLCRNRVERTKRKSEIWQVIFSGWAESFVLRFMAMEKLWYILIFVAF